MDYIQEELLRHQRLWQQLLAGGEQPEEEPESPEQETEEAAVSAASSRSGTEAPARQGLSFRLAQVSRRRRAESLPLPETAHGEPTRERAPIPAAALTARDLSRTIQRDARRYDGAFPLY